MEDRDYKQRTPLQVAAELGMVIYWIKTEKFLNVSVILLSCYHCMVLITICQYLTISSLVLRC